MKSTLEDSGLPRPFQSEKLTHSAISTGMNRKIPRMMMIGAVNSHPAIPSPRRIPEDPARERVLTWSVMSAADHGLEVRLHRVEDRLGIPGLQALQLRVEVGYHFVRPGLGGQVLGIVRTGEERAQVGVLAAPLLSGRLDRRHRTERLRESELLVGCGQVLHQVESGLLVGAVGGHAPAVGELQGAL